MKIAASLALIIAAASSIAFTSTTARAGSAGFTAPAGRPLPAGEVVGAVLRVWPAAAHCAGEVAQNIQRHDGLSDVGLERAPAELVRLSACFREMEKRPRLRALLEDVATSTCARAAVHAVDVVVGVLERSSSVAAEMAWLVSGTVAPHTLGAAQDAVRDEVRSIAACRLAPRAAAPVASRR